MGLSFYYYYYYYYYIIIYLFIYLFIRYVVDIDSLSGLAAIDVDWFA